MKKSKKKGDAAVVSIKRKGKDLPLNEKKKGAHLLY